jgi:hypothetical protein
VPVNEPEEGRQHLPFVVGSRGRGVDFGEHHLGPSALQAYPTTVSGTIWMIFMPGTSSRRCGFINHGADALALHDGHAGALAKMSNLV